MLVFIIRRSLQSVVVLLVMSLLVFVGVYAVGNPIDMVASAGPVSRPCTTIGCAAPNGLR